MSLKTFFKSKINRILTALTVVAVAGAGISVGAVAANNKAQEADAIDANDEYYWGLIGGFSGNSWSSDVCTTTAHGDSSAQGYESTTGTKTLGPYNITSSIEFKIRANSGWSAQFGKTTLGKVNSTYFGTDSNSEYDNNNQSNATINSGYNGYYTFVLSGNLYNYHERHYGISVYYNSSASSFNVTEYRVLGGTVEGSSFNTDTASLGVLFTPSTPASVTGYSFDGWYTDSACSTSYSTSRFSSGTTLYAKYTATASYAYRFFVQSSIRTLPRLN
jgi:hypothetical protein